MAQDEELTKRFRSALASKKHITEKRMMGGTCFFVNGNMIGGADRSKQGERRFMFRVVKDNEEEALARVGASSVEFTGRKMGGMVFVDEAQCDTAALKNWIKLSFSFVSTLPAK